MTRSKTPLSVVATLAMLIGVSGCGGDDETPIQPTPTPVPTVAPQCVDPAPAAPADDCSSVTDLSFAFPGDVANASAGNAQLQFDCLAWQSFIALNWPAQQGCRGVPDTTAQFAAGVGPRVWETLKTVFEVFQSQNPTWDPSNQAWNSAQPSAVCSDMAGGKKVLRRANKSPIGEDILDEFQQAFATGFGMVTDQAGNLVRYEVRFNRDEFEFIKANGYAITGRYSFGGPFLPAGEFFQFPDNTKGFTGHGAIEVKASWKELTDRDNPTRYYTQPAVIFEEGSGECRPATVGLVGLHIAQKTFSAPQWLWSTFEQVDNVPPLGSNGDGRQYTLFNPNCTPAAPDNCWSVQEPVSSEAYRCCANLELNPGVFPPPGNGQPGTPNQVTRLNAVGTEAATLNAHFQQLTDAAQSPFQYYQLINAQWPVGGRAPDNPGTIRTRPCNPNGAWRIPPVTTDCYMQVPQGLRNSSMETYMGDYGSGTVQFNSDSCMNCHGVAGRDFSYVWLDAKTNIVPITQ
jgi:hypothetical protein